MGNESSSEDMTGPVLAMYDIRGKQEFIFRTNKLQEIVGASWIIRDLFKDYLFPAAEVVAKANGKHNGIYTYKDEITTLEDWKNDGKVEKAGFKGGIREGYIGEVIYDGGGNFLVVFENEEMFREVTYELTKNVMESIGTLRILATCIPASEGFSDYKGDQKKLYAKHRISEAQESNIAPWSCIPIVQVDRKTSQPLFDYKNNDEKNEEKSDWDSLPESVRKRIERKGVHGKLTKESYAKLKKFFSEYVIIKSKSESEIGGLSQEIQAIFKMNEDILDEIVEEKGKDSQLAVVYIDGNNMGAKVQKVLGDDKSDEKTDRSDEEESTSYADCSNKLRKFSDEIQDIYVEHGLEHALSVVKDSDKEYRVVVSAGDEINYIVKAKDAFRSAKEYLKYLKEQDNASACAGIAVFHSHTPYADAYRIAEEACETGKQLMKKVGIETACLIDFHICQGGIGTSLDRIREDENGGEENLSRPWMIWGDLPKKDENTDYSNVTDYDTEVKRIVKILGIFSRSNVKGLASAAKSGNAELKMELNRMHAHLSDGKKSEIRDDWRWLMEEMDEDKRRRIMYDISIAYDLWFAEKGKGEG